MTTWATVAISALAAIVAGGITGAFALAASYRLARTQRETVAATIKAQADALTATLGHQAEQERLKDARALRDMRRERLRQAYAPLIEVMYESASKPNTQHALDGVAAAILRAETLITLELGTFHVGSLSRKVSAELMAVHLGEPVPQSALDSLVELSEVIHRHLAELDQPIG